MYTYTNPFYPLVNYMCPPIETIISNFMNYVVSQVKNETSYLQNGTLYYLEYDIPTAYISKYGNASCIKVLEKFLKSNGINRVEYVEELEEDTDYDEEDDNDDDEEVEESENEKSKEKNENEEDKEDSDDDESKDDEETKNNLQNTKYGKKLDFIKAKLLIKEDMFAKYEYEYDNDNNKGDKYLTFDNKNVEGILFPIVINNINNN